MDQSKLRKATAESHQIYVALTPVREMDLSTVLMHPINGWSLESISRALRKQFPSFYEPPKPNSKRKKGDRHKEGYKFPQDQHDWLLSEKMCTVVKPTLNAGDALIWSSALPHCGAVGIAPRKAVRRPRLGVITAFAPGTKSC